jgi:hypothetical protein
MLTPGLKPLTRFRLKAELRQRGWVRECFFSRQTPRSESRLQPEASYGLQAGVGFKNRLSLHTGIVDLYSFRPLIHALSSPPLSLTDYFCRKHFCKRGVYFLILLTTAVFDTDEVNT